MNPHSFSRSYMGGSQLPSLDRLGYNGNGGGRSSMADYNIASHTKDEHGGRHNGDQSRPVASLGTSSGPTGKRCSRACVACRKGKNRCEPDPSGNSGSCRRCLMNDTQCVFEKPERRDGRSRNEGTSNDGWAGDAEGRVSTLEKSVQELANGQNQIQSTLQQILTMLPHAGSTSQHTFMSNSESSLTPLTGIFGNHTTSTSPYAQSSPAVGQGHRMSLHDPRSPQNTASGRLSMSEAKQEPQSWPKLPGFAPPNHRFGTYGIIPLSSAPPSPGHARRSSRSASTDSTSDAAVPLVAPIQALQALANAADQAAALAKGDDSIGDTAQSYNPSSRRQAEDLDGDGDQTQSRKRKRVTIDGHSIQLRVRKQTKPDPTPRNPFPDVVTKGLVTEAEARELWDIFFSGCHYFVPLWDKKYDDYESYVERTPFSTNGLLAVAAKIRAGNGPLGPAFHRCLEEAQGIARSTLFGPIVRKEAVMAMLILSVWSQYGWLPVGHALRMGLDINLHRALDRLAEAEKDRSESEERDLVVSARIWLNCYLHENLSSLGTGKPLILRDDSSVRAARVLLSHPMASETDPILVARVELVNLRIEALERLNPLHGRTDAATLSLVHTILQDLQNWHTEWHNIIRERHDDDSVVVNLLEVELVYAQLWIVCVALRGCQWDKLLPEQRELAFRAKDAALRCVHIYLYSRNFRQHLKHATHDQLATVAFAAVFLLKIAMLYPNAMSMPSLSHQVSEVVHVLSTECYAERYALTLKLMLSNSRRKTGTLSTVPGTPHGGGNLGSTLPPHPSSTSPAVGEFDGGLQSLLSLPQMTEGMGDGVNNDWPLFGDNTDGFAWPTEFSPSNLPTWLQDNSFADLGLPLDGSDSLFLPLELANMFLPSGTTSSATYQFALPDSGDAGAAGAEAW